MSVSTAIGMVSRSLRSLLLAEMSLIPSVPVTILAPDEIGGDRRINLFLYKVQENATLKNLDWQVKYGESDHLVPPPLSLDLFYLMTAYATNDTETGNSPAHEILGDAMRVFYENAIVPPDYLEDSTDGIKNAREQIKITMNSLDLEELSRVWSTFTHPFRLSVLYQVSVVQLDMLSKKERGMAKRVEKIGKPAINAPFIPPIVNSMEPAAGPVASPITFKGANLTGWQAYVTVMGKSLVNGVKLSQDSFQVKLPGDLPPGFYEIRIDISHLFRRTFYFEVTA